MGTRAGENLQKCSCRTWAKRSGKDSGEGGRGRAPVGLRAKLAHAGSIPAGARCVSIDDRRSAGGANSGREGRCCRRGHSRGKLRAAGRCVERRAGIRASSGAVIRVRAVVCPMTPAAERQARLVDPGQDSRKRPQPEKQDQRDGKCTSHLPCRLEVSWHQNTNSTIPKCWSGMIES
jgi:hypothetical protein